MQIWEALIHRPVRVNLSCPSQFQKTIVAFFCFVNKCNCGDFLEIIFHGIHGNNIPLLKILRELVLESLGKYDRNRPAQSLNTSGITGTSIKLDTLNHVVVKD